MTAKDEAAPAPSDRCAGIRPQRILSVTPSLPQGRSPLRGCGAGTRAPDTSLTVTLWSSGSAAGRVRTAYDTRSPVCSGSW
jgi:hypothetical protein